MNHDIDAEKAVLAACLWSPVARKKARYLLTGADFNHSMHEVVWEAMTNLDRHGKPVDFVTVQTVLAATIGAPETMLELSTAYNMPDQVEHYANIVRNLALKRRYNELGVRIQQRTSGPELLPTSFGATVVNEATAIRDAAQGDDDTGWRMLAEFEDMPDADYEWVIDGLLERGDRLILTGSEGLGKSTILRQTAVYAAAGVHPFEERKRIRPIKAMIYDSENSERQIKRKVWKLHQHASAIGERDPGMHVLIDCPGRIDITRDRDLARLHRLIDMHCPDLLVIGPLYRLHPRALQTDDEASPVLAALDTVKDRGVALLIEAHAGHAIGHNGREWRPRGSSALMGWPEFGYGLSSTGQGFADLVAWRGARDEREWPTRIVRDESTMTWRKVRDDHPAASWEAS